MPTAPATVAAGEHYLRMAAQRGVPPGGAVGGGVGVGHARAGRCRRPSRSIWFVPHQANVRIIDAAAQRLGIPTEQTVVNIDRYGNTSAASVPLALAEAAEDGRLEPGDLVLLSGFGAGMAWA